MQSTPDIFTSRLRLTPVSELTLEAESTSLAHLSQLLDAQIPAEWPPTDWEPHVFEFIRKQYAQTPETVGWHRYVVLRSGEPTLIGCLGAFPKKDFTAEIGYSILPPWQRLGLATEGVLAFLAELREHPAAATIIAHTFPDLTPSLRVLENCGFLPDGFGEEQGTLRFCLAGG